MLRAYLSVLVISAIGVAGCVESDSDCTPNARRCDGDEVQICNEEGSGWLYYQACDVGDECTDGVCGSTLNCGDTVCDEDENCSVCPGDCPCQTGETCVSGVCEADTPADCPNGTCGADENCDTCPADCACQTGETCVTGVCETDTPVDCPNGTCGADEDCDSCPADCGVCPIDPDFDCNSGSCSFTDCEGTVTGPELYFAADIVTVAACTTALPQWFTDRECIIPQYTWDDITANPNASTCYLYQWACPCVDGTIQWMQWAEGEGNEFTPSLAEPTCDAMPASCCTPDCTGQDCGDDGCGGSCGTCPGSEICAGGTTCECPSACQEGLVCCGGPFCGGDCSWNTCCL